MEIVIDEEFEGLCESLTSDEFALLEESVLKEGIRDPLVAWGGILLDGHHRYKIAKKHRLHYATVTANVQTREEAFNWIINNQLGRRNLTREQASYLRGQRYNKEKQRGFKGNQYESGIHHNDGKHTAERLGAQFNVGKATIERDGEFAEAVEKIGKISPSTKKAILKREVQSTRGEVEMLAAKPVQEIERIAVRISEGKVKDLSHAVNRYDFSIVAETEYKPHLSQNTGENEWFTPAKYIEAAREVMGKIDLDPASTAEANKIVCAANFYTKEEDGLSKMWEGKVWLNPPYSRCLIGLFITHLVSCYNTGAVEEAIVLVDNATETDWFFELATNGRAIIFPNKRVKFWHSSDKISTPLRGQAFVYFGTNTDRFLKEFGGFGWQATLKGNL